MRAPRSATRRARRRYRGARLALRLRPRACARATCRGRAGVRRARRGRAEALRSAAGGNATRASPSTSSTASAPRARPRARAKLDRMSVADRLLLELCDESRLIELRVVSRAGRAPNVDDGAHPGLTECRDELVGGSRAVPDRPDGHRRRPTTDRRRFHVSEHSWTRHRIGLATPRDRS